MFKKIVVLMLGLFQVASGIMAEDYTETSSTVTSGGGNWSSSNTYQDDVSEKFGTDGDVDISFDTNTSGDQLYVMRFAESNGSTDIPVWAIGDASLTDAVLSTTWDNVTHPTLALYSDAATAYMGLYHDGTNFNMVSNKGGINITPSAFSAPAATDQAIVKIAPVGVTVPTGATTTVATLRVSEPIITETGTVTNVANIYVDNVATEGDNNYAIWVDAGAVRIDEQLLVNDGQADFDTQIKSNDNDYAIFIDASANRVGIMNGSPSVELDVTGAIKSSGNITITDGVFSMDKGTGTGQATLDGSAGGCIMIRDTDDAGWTECDALDGTLSCSTDADGVCD